MIIIRYIFFSLLFFSTLNHVPKDNNIFVPPVKIPIQLSANFGELRIDHFHSGIDIKTQGVTGKEVVASADGFVYRISVSPTGFGKALYVKHPSGYSTVYGHLDHFAPGIEEYVKSVQYERKSFAVTVFPPKEKFPVKQGEQIAWSGNSGSSGGPHLHFEVRETDGEVPVNPLLFKLGASDNIAPIIEKLAVYPVGSDTYINNHHSKLIYNVTGSNGKYTIGEKELVISGNTGFGIKIHDLLNGATNRCAAYSMTLEIDSMTVYKYVMDGFAFTESRYVNSHMDYETFMRDNIRIEKLYALPNDKFTAYKSMLNRGVFNFGDDRTHLIKITVMDADNNRSVLAFRVRSISDKPGKPVNTKNEGTVMPYNKANKFSREDISVSIPSGALYDTLLFAYKKSPATPVMLSDLHSIHDIYTPVQKPYSLMIKPTIVPKGMESKMLIVQLNDNMSKTPVNSTFSEGFLKADVQSFGNFYVGIDTIAPSISASGLSEGVNLSGKKELRIRIKDDFSGIKSYEPEMDGKWALFEYDPKTTSLIYTFDTKYISKGAKHNLSLKVTDNRDNVSYYKCNFTW